MTEPYMLVWIADGEKPEPGDLEVRDWAHPNVGPLLTLDAVVAYLSDPATEWLEGYRPWVRQPDGMVLSPDILIGYLPE